VIFLQPLALLGLAAAGIPALLHLLHRREPPILEFPALRYLSDAERQSARRLRLRHLLLLILRTVLIVFVVLAAARPLVPVGSGAAHEPTALVVVLDNSPSAGAVVDGRPVLDRLRLAARASIAATRERDRVWLMLADGVARAGSREALLARLDSAAPAAWRLALADAVDRAARLVQAEPLAGREVHVLSDLQRTALSDRASPAPGVRVLALAAAAAPANRGVAAAHASGAAVRLAIAGTAGAGAGAVTVRLAAGGRVLERALAAPGDEVGVPLPGLPVGWWVGEAELEPDEMRADDRRLFAWRVAPPARVAAAPDAGPFVSAGLAVLQEAGRVAAGGEIVIADRPGPGPSIVLPPADPALVGQANRALSARGASWRFGGPGTPGRLAAPEEGSIDGAAVARRYRLERVGPDTGRVLAAVNAEPWLVRSGTIVLLGSRLDTAWTSLPAMPGFVPFLDGLVNRVARGEAPVREAEGLVGVRFEERGGDTVGVTVFGPDPRESDLEVAATALARRSLGARVLDEAAFAAERFAGTRRADASGFLVACALLLAVAELVAASRMR
jgi:hypothetical protein